MPINPINFALASALLLMPSSYSVEQYQAPHQTVTLEWANNTNYEQIAKQILASSGTLEMFYRLAYADITFFDAFPEGELAQRFAQTREVLKEAQAFRNQLQELDDNLDVFSKNFNKLYRLYESYEYKKEADRVLLPRADSPIVVTFDHNSTDEEIRAFIFGA